MPRPTTARSDLDPRPSAAMEPVDAVGSAPGSELVLAPKILLAAILGLVALVYLPTLRFPFVYDDGWTLVSNGFLRHPNHLPLLFGPEAALRHVPDAFRPTLVAFDTVTYQLFGLRPTLHHAASVMLHVSVCWALARLVEHAGAPLAERLAAVGLFGVMAIHAEAVAVISFHEDLLAAGLGLAALAVAEHSSHRTDRGVAGPCVAVTVLLALAAWAKMSAVPLAIVWTVMHRVGPWRPPSPARRFIPLAVALTVGSALPVLHRVLVYGDLSPYGETPRVLAQTVGLGPVLAQTMQIHLSYLQQMLVPVGLSPEYVDKPAAWHDTATVLASAALAGVLAYGLTCLWRRRHPVVGVGIVAAALLALPTSNLMPMPNLRADRFMYLPSVPVAVVLGVGCIHLGRHLAARTHMRELLIAPILIYGVIQGALAFATSATYANNGTLWEVAVTKAPNSARAQALRGIQRIVAGNKRESVDEVLLAWGRAHCRLSLQLDPQEELAHVCLGRLHMARRQWGPAHASFSRALALHGARPDLVLATLAELSFDLPAIQADDHAALAVRSISRGLREYPYSADLWATAARIFHRHGHPYTALLMLRTARSMRPERWETVLAAVELQLDLGNSSAAHRTLLEEYEVLGAADPSRYRAISARLSRAQDFWPASVIQPLLAPGVFPR